MRVQGTVRKVLVLGLASTSTYGVAAAGVSPDPMLPVSHRSLAVLPVISPLKSSYYLLPHPSYFLYASSLALCDKIISVYQGTQSHVVLIQIRLISVYSSKISGKYTKEVFLFSQRISSFPDPGSALHLKIRPHDDLGSARKLWLSSDHHTLSSARSREISQYEKECVSWLRTDCYFTSYILRKSQIL